ncbi:MAG: hypothetical protein ACK55D_06650 [Synechococcaceae cyanobacterium]
MLLPVSLRRWLEHAGGASAFFAMQSAPFTGLLGFGQWLAEAVGHAFGNPREEAEHQPPLVGVQPYRDRPSRPHRRR